MEAASGVLPAELLAVLAPAGMCVHALAPPAHSHTYHRGFTALSALGGLRTLPALPERSQAQPPPTLR
jgi:hypothetical protein